TTYEASEKEPGMWESLRTVMQDSDKSALRILLAIFFWFLGYTAIEAFFTLYAKNHLGLEEADGARLLGQLSLVFVIFALPAGYLGGRFGRRPTTGKNYNNIMIVAPIFMLVALAMMVGVKRGEAVRMEAAATGD
ncbi:MAG: SLC45 family MFS transporter, partial [Chloroflexi bacterium]|nr:SLC45 family MFS transporter [Chloroflexota bacterium]